MKKTATLFSCHQSGQFGFFKNNIKILLMLFFLFSGLFLTSIKSVAQSSDFKQGANRDNSYNKNVGEINWIGSILQSNNSRYVEGMSTLQRIILTDVPDCNGQGRHKLRIKLESDKSGNHAYDFITSWDNAFKAAAAIAPGFGLMPANRADPKLHECGPAIPNSMDDLCDLVTNGATGDFRDLPVIFDGTNAVGAGETNLAILGDQNTTRNVIQNYENRYPDNILANGESYGRSVRIYVNDGSLVGTNGDADNRVVFVGYSASEAYYDISWRSTSSTVVIEFAAHIAVGVDGLDGDPNDADGLGVGYFLGQGASDISGGPYHVSMENFFNIGATVPAGQAAPNGSVCEGNLGSEDNQLQGSQVLLVPQCHLTGDQTACEGETGLTYQGGVVNALNATYVWSILPNTSPTGAQITAGQGTAGPVTVTAGSAGTFTLILTVTNGGTTQDPDDNIVSTCTIPVTVSGGPTIDCPDNRTTGACQTQLQVNAAYTQWLAEVTPTDASNNGGSVGPDKCGGVKTVTFTATNDCGTATCSASFTVTADHTPPGFTGSYDDVNLTCNSEVAPGSLGSASATDACGTPSISHTDGSVVSDGCLRSLKRTFTATDGCNNTATISRTVRWKAVISNPILRAGGQNITGTVQEIDLGCQPPEVNIEAQLGSATAENGCATPTVSAVTDPQSVNGCARSVKRTFTATDDCGHIVTAARIIRWIVNNLGPQVNATGAPITLGCNPSEAEIDGALGSVSATDACTNVTITPSDGPTISNGCSRERTRTFTATGGCGNTATASRTVTWKSDNSAPTFTGSYGDVTLGCNPENPSGSLGSASATDGCGPVTITQSDGGVQSSGCARSITRKFTATDGCLNTATTSRTVRWTSDVLPPVFTGSYSDVTLGCNPENPSGSLGSASATDGCGPVTITQSDGGVQSSGCARSITRKFTATDGCLNTATTSRTVRWTSDVLPPVFTGSYSDVTLNCNPENPGGSLGSASATDGCGPVTITQSDGGVQSNGCARSITRKFTATDGCLNTATTSRTVRWTSDITGPVLTCAANYTAACGTTDPVFTPPSASDACGTPTTVPWGDVVVQGECPTTYTKKWISTDACGNTSTCSQTVTVPCCSANCTYTQGKYGQDQDISSSCDGTTSPNNPYIPSALIEHDLLAYGGLLRVGCVGHSVTISTGEASCVLAALPGGGPSGPLAAGDFSICSLPAAYLSKKGTINNALLAQTITLGLNLGINPAGGLGNFAIQANKYLVTADLVACGSTTVKECTFNCTPNPNVIGQYIWTVKYSPYHVSECKFSQALYNALTTKNVAGLYALANSALCGDALPAGVAYSDITNAVDCINNAFDECRAFTGWFTEKPTANSFCTLPSATTPCTDPVTRITSQGAMESVAEVTSLKVSAYPNPFRDKVSFVINSQVSGQGSLQVYNMLGQRIATVYNGAIVAGRSQIVEYNAPRSFNGGMIYIFRVGGKQVTGKLMNVQ